MSGSELEPHRYGEKEISLILRRASEIQRREPSARDPAGLTLAELEEIATEAGIDPSNLRRAAAELDTLAPPDLASKLAGAPIRLWLEKTLPGEVSPAAFEELVPLIQLAADSAGQASTVGKTLTWSSTTAGNTRSMQVLVAARAGETLVRIEERMGGLAGGLFGGILGGVGGGVGLGVGGALGGILGSVALAVAFPTVIIGASYWATRRIFAAQVAKRRRQLEGLMERVTERILDHETREPLEATDAGGWGELPPAR